MKKKLRNLKDIAIFFKIIHFEAIEAVLLIISWVTIEKLKTSQYAALRVVLISLIWITLTIVLVWLYTIYVRNRHYFFMTGRTSLRDDLKNYQIPRRELINFWAKSDSYKMDTSKLEYSDWRNPECEGIILCKVKDKFGKYKVLNINTAATKGDGANYITFGLPGSSKTTTQAVPSFMKWNPREMAGVFAISCKGDLQNMLGTSRPYIRVITPDKEEGSSRYDPLRGIELLTETERKVFFETMATCICPSIQGNDPTYIESARDIFCAVGLYLYYLHEIGKRPGRLKFPTIVDTILQNDSIKIAEVISKSKCCAAKSYIESYLKGSERFLGGVYNTLTKAVRPLIAGGLREIFSGDGEKLEPKDLNRCDIIIDVPVHLFSVYAPAIRLITSQFMMYFLSVDDISAKEKSSEEIPKLFLLDEFAALKIDWSTMETILSLGRSRNVSVFMLLQSLNQLISNYGENKAHQIIDLCGYVSVFSCTDINSARYFQQLFGKKRVLTRSVTSSPDENGNIKESVNIGETNEYTFEIGDFGDLDLYDKKGNLLEKRVLVWCKGRYVLGTTTPYWR